MSEPVLIIPTLGRLRDAITSIDIPVRLVVIANGGTEWDWLPDDAWLIELPHNIGYPAAVNLGIKCHPDEPYWLVANDDVVFAPGDLADLCRTAQDGRYGWVGLTDWRVFALTAETVQRVGWLDEGFHPAYCEDADYERRCDLAGIRWGFIEGRTSHEGSACLREHRDDNDRSYPRNVQRYRDKWGVGVRAPGGHATPFDAGHPDPCGPPLSVLRANAWHRRDGGA